MLHVHKCLALATLTLCLLPLQLGLAAPKRIGLLPVKNFSGYTGGVDFGSIIEGEISSRLVNNSNYTMVERSHLKEVLNELGYDLNTGYTDDISQQVAKTAGLDYIITAEVTQATVAEQYIPLVGQQIKAKVGVRLIAIDKNEGRRIFDQTAEDTATKQDLSDLSAIAVIGALGGFGSHDDDSDSHRDRDWHRERERRDDRDWHRNTPPRTYGDYPRIYRPGPQTVIINRGPQVPPPGYRPAPNGNGQPHPWQTVRPGDPNSDRSQQRPGDPNSGRSQQRPGDPNSYQTRRPDNAGSVGPSSWWRHSAPAPRVQQSQPSLSQVRPQPPQPVRQQPSQQSQNRSGQSKQNSQQDRGRWQPQDQNGPYRHTSYIYPVQTVEATFVVPLPSASYEPKFVDLPAVSAANVRTISTDTYLEKYGAALIADATKGAARKAMNQFEEFNPVVGTVISIDADNVYIDLGQKDGLREGDKVTVYREGNPIRNTEGVIVLVPQKKIARLKIESVSEAASICSGNDDVRLGDKVRRGEGKE